MEIEAREVAGSAVRKGIAAAILAGAAFFTWALLLAGGIALAARQLSIEWGWLALAAAGVHLLVALVAMARLKKPAAASFSLTRSEFQRDREWFKNL